MENLRERRLALGLSQAEFGKRCGYSRSYISEIERGTCKDTKKVLAAIQQVLDGKISHSPQQRKGAFIPTIPFKNASEKNELRRIWLENYAR